MTAEQHPLADGFPESWAADWGEDKHGVFAGFAVGDAVQRLRWVPPGRFMMGSPEGEAGRFADESPWHEVTISQGLWLADTPVTQALWKAVMGQNPSRFVSPDRPVEQVSWEDCQAFIARLNDVVSGLGVRLPSEAEWEYACRAGTATATWVGNLEVIGEDYAPILDAIAWHAWNSGHGFQLADDVDSSDVSDKEHAHSTRAGTWPVKGKSPNPNGLYDMLGNTWEWCEDRAGTYHAVPAIDPTGPTAGLSRVFRGGSWNALPRYVRAARRGALAPEGRLSVLGFRLARSPSTPAAEPPSSVGRSRHR